MGKQFEPLGIEINPQRVGVLLTDHIGDTLRLFDPGSGAHKP